MFRRCSLDHLIQSSCSSSAAAILAKGRQAKYYFSINSYEIQKFMLIFQFTFHANYIHNIKYTFTLVVSDFGHSTVDLFCRSHLFIFLPYKVLNLIATSSKKKKKTCNHKKVWVETLCSKVSPRLSILETDLSSLFSLPSEQQWICQAFKTHKRLHVPCSLHLSYKIILAKLWAVQSGFS